MGRLDNKVALISGGARGQGACEGKLFAREGAKVVLADLLDDDGMKVEAEIRELGGDATYVHMDVTSEQDWAAAVKLAETKYGKLDILVNNAAIYPRKSIEEITPGEWDRVMDINGKGVLLGTKWAIPAMRRAGGGSIVNISSTHALKGGRFLAGAYSAAKAAVRILTKTTAIEYADDGIRCNTVYPGLIDTLMVADLLGDPIDRAERSIIIPLGRIGTVEDIAYGVLYLASDESSYVTGTDLIIDGGRMAG